MEKSETIPDPNQEIFKIYLILSPEILKIKYEQFSINKDFQTFICEKIFPTNNNICEPCLLSSSYNIKELNNTNNKEFCIYYSDAYSSDKYILNSNDNFLFDVKFKMIKESTNYTFPKCINLSGRIQYKYFCEFLKENKLQSSYVKKNLNRDVMKLISKNKTIDFAFYLDIFKEVFTTDYVKTLLSYFKSDKIIMKDKIDSKTHSAVLKLIYKKSNKVLDLVVGNKKKNFAEKLYLFIIFYYYNVLPNEFQSIMNEKIKNYNNEFEINLIDLFFKNEIMFKPNNDNNIIFMFNFIQSYEQLNCLLKKFKEFSNWLKIIEKNKEIIYQLLKKDNNNIKIDDCQCKPKENELNDIFTIVNKIEEYSKKINYKILIIPDNFYEIILSNCGNNIENLNKIKEILLKSKHSEKIIFEIEEKYHNICENKILNDKLINLEMLECLSKDPYYQKPNTEKMYNNKKNIIFILERINFSKLSKNNDDEINNFFHIYHKINFEKILPLQSYIELNKGLVNKIKNFDDFQFVFNFVNFEKKIQDILKFVHEKLKHLLQESKGRSKNTQYILISYITININIGNKNFIKEIINEIDKILNPDKSKEIIIKTYNMIDNNDKELSQFLLNIFEKDLINANVDTITLLLEKVEKKNLRELIKKFNPLIMKDEDIYKEKDTEKYKIYKFMKESKYFDDNNLKDLDYIKLTNNLIKNIYKDLKGYNIDFTNCTNIYNLEIKNDKTILNRLLLLFDENNIKELYKNILNGIKSLLQSKKDIKEILLFLMAFYPSCQDKPQITNLNKSISNSKLKDSIKYKNEINKYTQRYRDLAESYNMFKFSNFFKAIFQDSKGENIEIKLNNTKKSFETLSNLFDQTNFNMIKPDIFQLILKSIKRKDSLKKEMDFLKKYFKIEKNTERIEEILILLASKNKMLSTLKGLKYLFKNFEIKKGEFTNTINEILNSLKNELPLNELSNIIDYLQKVKIDVMSEPPHMLVLNLLTNKIDFLPFIKDKTIDDMRNLAEFVGEDDNSSLKASDIQDLIKCIDFIVELRKFTNLIDIEFFQNLIQLTNKFKNIEGYLSKVNQNFYEIKELYTKNIDKSEFTKQKVRDIYNSSFFNIENKNGIYICYVTVIDKNKNEKKFNFDEVLEVRDRALLKKKDDDNKDNFFELAHKFSSLINNIEKLIDFVNEINEKGYPEDMKYKISINRGVAKINGNDISQDIIKIREILTRQNILQKDNYLNCSLIRFLYGKEFSLFTKYLKYKKGNITHILQYITNNNYKEIKFKYKDSGDIIKDSLINSNQYLIKLFDEINIDQSDIYQNNLLKKDDYKGLKSSYSSKESIEKDVIKIYKILTGNIPLPQTLLYCNEQTSSVEVTAFLYRAILCEYKSLFVIMNIEQLQVQIWQDILDILNSIFIENRKNMVSCLLFVYYDMASAIIQEIKKINGHNILDIPNLDDKDIIFNNDDIQIIYSDACGVGKSTYIKEFIKLLQKNYIYFPVGGEFTRDEVIERLKEFKYNSNSVIHLDLYDTNKVNLMKEFLFSLLITKWYSRNENIFYLGNKVNIMIEIPYGFVNYMMKFPILNLFKKKIISIKELPNLKISDNITSNIQIVCNYLKFFDEDKINKANVYIKGISNENHKNMLQAQSLDQQTCQNLLNKFFQVENSNYYQKLSFINIIASQLILFTNNLYLDAGQIYHFAIGKKQKELLKIRSFMIEALIKNTEHFTKGAYTNLIQNQVFTQNRQSGKYDEEKDLEEAIKKLENKEIISYKQIRPSLIFFNLDGISLSIITNCKKTEPEYQRLRELYNSGVIDKKKEIDLIDYQNINHEKFYEELNKVLDLNIPTGLEKNQKNNNKETIKSIVGSYVFTSDNFIKMILILFRIQANIPVIMMGETGCGKTSLIRIISQLLKSEMKILNIHAGISDRDIIEFMEGKIKEKNDINLILDNQNIEFFKNIDIKHKIWIFLDEINTCNSMGLISEMMCKHTINGRKIDPRVTFIAACNPYRSLTKKIEIIGLVAKEDKKRRNLVYTVNPLPYSLLNYVFDFGNLTQEDELKYIKSIVTKTIYERCEKGDINKDEFEFARNISVEAISKSQNFIREKNEASSVSLREVRRFNIFFDFFYDYLNNKGKSTDPDVRDSILSLSKKEFLDQVVNLSIFICYCIRISDKNTRNEYLREMEKIFGHNFEEIPLREENYVASNVKIGKGIAKNKALLDNLFTLFVCVNTQVPVFICGKPGCSKSLSVQLLFKSMKGENSENELFRTLPKLIMNSYQGSKTSTSKGVLKIFEKARDVVRNATKRNVEKGVEKIISMIYFDEMGLAEVSPNNPLKVIHSQLEYDENEDKIAFVGISNWTLDASKMNRGIYLAIPEPDEEDLQKTALTIAESYDNEISNTYADFFRNLASTYYHYKLILNTKNKLEDFHGSRDFYNYIKNATNLIRGNNEIDENLLTQTGMQVLERNFGGIAKLEGSKNSVYVIEEIFKKRYENTRPKNEYEVMECIKRNIQDKEGRYLLVISKSSISPYLLGNILTNMEKEYIFYLGSQFENDQIGEFYSVKILNKIISIMEEGKVLILKDLESIYPSLYDLFNQNFTKVSNKNFARIALGSSNNALSQVHEDFKCIILVDENEIEKEEAPFLNRFEKHILSFESLLSPEIRQKVDDLYNIIHSISKLAYEMSPKFKFELENQLVNCDKEEFLGIAFSNKNNDEDSIQNEILKKIVPTFSQDILVAAKTSTFDVKNPGILNQIFDIYNEGEHTNLSNFLKKTNSQMNVVYTFSSILGNIKIVDRDEDKGIFNNTFNLKIMNDSLLKINVAKLKSENDLDKELLNFGESKILNVCLLQFLPNDTEKMNSIKFYLENYIKENEKLQSKIFIFMVHLFRIEREIKKNNMMMKRNNMFQNEEEKLKEKEKKEKEEKERLKKIIKNQSLISHLAGFNQIFIDNLNGLNVSIKEILEKKNEEVFAIKKLINIETEINKNIFNSFSSIKYNFKNKIDNFNNQDYQKKLTEKIIKNEQFQEKIKSIIGREIINSENIALVLFKDPNGLQKDDIDFITGIKNFQIHTIKMILTKLIVKCERDQVLSFLINENNNNDNFLVNCFNKYFDQLELGDEKPSLEMNSNDVQILMGMYIPGIKPIFENIIQYVNELKEEFYLNEDTIRNSFNEDEELEKELSDYNTKSEILINKVVVEFKKYDIFKYFEQLEKEKTEENENEFEFNVEKIYKDYFTIYLGNLFNGYNYSQFYLVLNTLVEKKFGERKENLIKDLSKTILWIESYSKIIYMILEMFNKIQSYKENLFEIIIEIIDDNQISFEVSERNPKFKKMINFAFFSIFESCIKSILNDADFFIDLKYDKFCDFSNDIKNILQNALQIETNLRLFSKEIFNLQSFIQILPYLSEEDQRKDNEIKELIDIMKKESEIHTNTELNNDEKIEQLINNLSREYDFLKEQIKDKEKFTQILMFIFDGKIKQISDKKYRIKLLDYVIHDNNLILSSGQFLGVMLGKEIGPNIEEDKNENENELLDEYLSFAEENDDEDIIYNELENQKENKLFDEIILYLFESYVISYFENFEELEEKDKIQSTINKLSLKYFKKSLNYIDDYLNQKLNNNYKYPHLALLMCIAYIKVYLTNLIEILMNDEKRKMAGNISNITDIINEPKKSNFRTVVKYFILKLVKCNLDDYNKFKIFDFGKIQLNNIVNEFDFNKETSISNFDYSFLPMEQLDLYSDNWFKFSAGYEKEFRNISTNDFINLINENKGFDVFFDITVNKIFSNLSKENFIEDNQNILNKFSTWSLGLIKNLKITDQLKLFLSILYDSDKLIKIKQEYLKGIKMKELEMLLFVYKILSKTQNQKKNFFYTELISKNIKSIIEKSYIPGDEPNENIWINSCIGMEDFLKKSNNAYEGVYICSCGQWYNVVPCGLPMMESECFVCKKKIGGTWHVPVDRDGHIRVCLNKKQEQEVLKYMNENKWCLEHPDKKKHKFRTTTIDVLKKEVEAKNKSDHLGVKKVTMKFFDNEEKKIRELNQISYRLLALIFYSSIYFAMLIGFINQDDCKEYLPHESNGVFEIMVKTFLHLENALKAKGIHEIQIFFNMICNKLSDCLSKCPLVNTIEIRKNIENKVNDIVNNCINEYEEYKKNYIETNNKINQIDFNSLRSIIQESINPLLYNENKYPLFRFFIIPKYPNKKHLIENLNLIPNYQQKYPIISSYLNDNGETDALQNIIKINPFTNSMIEKYTYKITRDKGKEIKIKDALTNEILRKQFEQFKEGWKNFSDFLKRKQKNIELKDRYLLQYKCRPPMDIKYINEEDPIAYALNDDGEYLYGMYLAAAYQKFIIWQNTFLNNIIGNISQSGVLHYFKDQLEKEIYAQDATNAEVISLNLDTNFSLYNSFEEIIIAFSRRNCFENDFSINYSNYKIIKYDYDLIEEELGKIILPGKKLFKNEAERFVTYGFEGYRGGNSTVIQDFIIKYIQRPLLKNERKILYDYTHKNNINYNEFMFSLQLLIFYLKNENYESDFSINEAIKNTPEFVKINDDCKEFFNKHEDFKLNILISIFEYIELLCYKYIIDNVNEEYKKKIEKSETNKILNYFENGEKKLIDKMLLATTVRRLISRFLSGKRGENEIKEDENLLYFLQAKEEFWNKEIFNNPEFDNEFENMISAFEVKVNEAIDFYEVLGGDKELLGDKKEFEEDENDDRNKDNNIDYNLIKRKKQ